MTEINTTQYKCDRCNRTVDMEAKDSFIPGRVVKGKQPNDWVQHHNEPHDLKDPLFCGSCQNEYLNWYARQFKEFMRASKIPQKE